MMATVPKSSDFPRRLRELELKEAKKGISFKSIPKVDTDLADARTIRNEELDVPLKSEAFDVGFSDFAVRNRRSKVF